MILKITRKARFFGCSLILLFVNLNCSYNEVTPEEPGDDPPADATTEGHEDASKADATTEDSGADVNAEDSGADVNAEDSGADVNAEDSGADVNAEDSGADAPVSPLQMFYIDSETGADSNSGHSENDAWKTLDKVNSTTFKPGDTILFKSGQTWSGTLLLKGSGTADKFITIGKYGGEDRPIINGNGNTDCSNHVSINHYCTIFVYNQEYWKITDLEITNYNASEENGMSLRNWEKKNKTDYTYVHHPAKYTQERLRKSAILVYARNYGAVKGLHFSNLKIHGVNGDITNRHNGGIFLRIFGSDSETPTYFDDLLVENCHIHDVDRTGLSNFSYYDDRSIDSIDNWTPTLNYVVRRNTFERTGANALIFRVAKSPLVEYNVFDHCAIKESGNAFFNFNTDDAIMQYNESRYTKYNVGDVDAGGIDSDFRTKNTIIQYNYIHNNDFGPLITGGPKEGFNDNTIVRYNIFENDGIARSPADNRTDWVFKISGNATNTYVHNNFFYINEEKINRAIFFHKKWTKYPSKTTYFNNIIINKGTNNYYELTNSTENLFTNNGIESSEVANLPDQQNLVEGDLMIDWSNGNYTIKPGSPVIGAGIEIIEMPSKDYFGNSISGAINIGISQ